MYLDDTSISLKQFYCPLLAYFSVQVVRLLDVDVGDFDILEWFIELVDLDVLDGMHDFQA